MTPEELIKKYKQKVGQYLEEGDKEILEAYLNLRVREQTESIARWVRFKDWAATISFAGVLLLVCALSFGAFTSCSAEDEVREQLAEEYGNQLEDKTENLEVCETELENIKSLCMEKILKGEFNQEG
jgi:cyclopropane fatty-acyl-phospholipid synthase-like methyltransferase